MKSVNLTLLWPLLPALLLGGALGALLGYFGQCTSGACPLTSTWWRGMIYGALLGLLFALPGRRPVAPAPDENKPVRAEESSPP